MLSKLLEMVMGTASIPEFPFPGPLKWAEPHNFYPFEPQADGSRDDWDAGKLASRGLTAQMPEWTKQAADAWMFQKPEFLGNTVRLSYANGAGCFVLEARDDLGVDAFRVMEALSASWDVSHEQKAATLQLALYRWCKLITHTKPGR